MCSIPVSNSISFDHTFKVASNIGYFREDKVWVEQYDSLFLVMNSNGQIVTWQFTCGTSLDQVQMVLQGVYECSKQQCQVIDCIYIDDCCKLRNKLEKILGNKVQVKLDVFHAVQRVIQTLSKSHSLYQQCVSELHNVFRKDGDISEIRSFDTPLPDVMEGKMNSFSEKWKDACDCESRQLFKPDTNTAIKNIIKHIRNGCLSNIPPGGGTNCNERFHQHIVIFQQE